MPMDCSYIASGQKIVLDCPKVITPIELDWLQTIGIGVAIIIVLWLLWLWLYPIYNVWASHKSGQADYAQALNEQNIQIAEAKSRLAAAEMNKKAAIVEAEAVAEQIDRIGQNLKKHDLYLRWQWIKMMEDRDSKADTIYVATEAGLPILEAGKR